jgi:arginyl-tRNA synthetase
MNLRTELESILSSALQAATGQPARPACVSPSAKPQFGDYQANGVMAAAKAAKTNPRQLAQTVLDELNKPGLDKRIEKIEIAGPGFLNITLSLPYINEQLNAIYTDALGATGTPSFGAPVAGDPAPGATAAPFAAVSRLGVDKPTNPQTVVVDYSSPNLAKEMHVGHIRTTIIGDALARTLEFVGHNVTRQNHVGDWGTQFGMLIAYLKQLLHDDPTGSIADTNLHDLEEFYRKAKAKFDSDPDFADASREEVVLLQSGDTQSLDMWRRFREVSMRHCQAVYDRLDVNLHEADIRGESDYNDDLASIVADLDKVGMLKESQGAQCVFLPEFVGRDGTPLPLIVQKSNEGYLYATTDLAAVRYRVNTLHADRVLYVIGAPQTLHLRQVFAVARKAGFAPQTVSLEHIAFGSMMGPDGKPFKTRTGGTVKLMDMLDEAVKKALDLITQRNAAEVAAGKAAPLPPEKMDEVANVVGIGAVKYADLSQNRNSDYVFSWDKMLSLDGNTAPYMQYAYARIQSILKKDAETRRRGDAENEHPGVEIRNPQSEIRNGATSPIAVIAPAERALAIKLLQFPETIAILASECLPNFLCAYLYDLAGAFTRFYEDCPVLKSDEPTRTSRLALCRLTAAVIKKGLDLLGIQTIDQM